MSPHTPGPWGFFEDNNYGGTVELGLKLTVCVDRADRFTSELVISRDEMNANGRLIAAAPDLLAALKLAHAEHAKSVLFGSEALKAMEAAIAKAEGRS